MCCPIKEVHGNSASLRIACSELMSPRDARFPPGFRACSNVPTARLLSKDETNAEGKDGKRA
jgi:hypothetical protein